MNRQVLLRERPQGLVSSTTTECVDGSIPECSDGQALIRVGYLSIDPTIRTWMDDAPGYLPPIEIGAVVRSAGAGVVVESRTSRYNVGDIVIGMTGWQQWCLATEENKFSVVPSGLGLDLPTVMNVLGVTGITAWFGMTDIGQLQHGDVVVVSGAAGATGSVAGQVAKARGASLVVGIAGGPEKCAEVVERFGFDACLDYREPHLARRLREVCPRGVDVYFDNVGGEVLDAVLLNIAMNGRIVLCGAISQYNDAGGFGLKNHTMMIMRRASMKGFIVLDYASRYAEAQLELGAMVLNGQLEHAEHLVDGIDNAPHALNLLFSGGNHGKTLVVVDSSVVLA